MAFVNGLDKKAFLQHMFEEFPSVFDNTFAREMLENIVDYGLKNHTVSKNGLYYFLSDMLPEVEPKDLVPFMDKNMLTGEVLSLVDIDDCLEEDVGIEDMRVVRTMDELKEYLEESGLELVSVDGVLPKHVSVPVDEVDFALGDVDFERSEEGALLYDKEAVADVLSDYLSDTYGYCHKGFRFTPAFDEYGKLVEFFVVDIQWDIDKEEELRVVRTLDELEEYLDDNGWSVYKDEEGWDIRQASPAGEDFGFFIRHGDDVETAIKEIKEYAYDFDIDEHVELNLGGRGAPGVVELVEDAKEIQKMLNDLADGVEWGERESIKETLAKATERASDSRSTAMDHEYEMD